MRHAASRVRVVLTAAAAALLVTAGSAAAADGSGSPPEPRIGPPCEPGYLCLFQEPEFSSVAPARVDLLKCGDHPIRVPLAGIGSFINNQTGDQVASFYTAGPNGEPVHAFDSVAVDAQPHNDIPVTFVKPC